MVTRDTLRSSDEITAARLQDQEPPVGELQQREYEALNVDSVARKPADTSQLIGGAQQQLSSKQNYFLRKQQKMI